MKYWQVTMVDKIMTSLILYAYLAWWSLWAILQKASFLLSFVKQFCFSKTLHQGMKPKCTNNSFLSQILLYENHVEILPSILVQLLEVVHHRGHG